MSIENISLRLVGVGPMLMRNSRLGDPLDHYAKALFAVTSKRLKTEADHQRIAELEFHGSLYLHHGAPCLPQNMIKAVARSKASSRRPRRPIPKRPARSRSATGGG